MAQTEIEVSNDGSEYPMIIITSPIGKRYSLSVDDNGILSTTEIT